MGAEFEISILLVMLVVVLGGFSGLLAGLLGVGGGLVLVPGLLFVFHLAGFDGDTLMHVCVGTSLFIIVFTGSSAAFSHWRKGGVNFEMFASLGVGIVAGAALGSVLASALSGQVLTVVFACALVVLTVAMVRDMSKMSLPPALFGRFARIVVGGVVGCISTLVGIGGGTMNVPYMAASGQPMRRAIGTASALGVLIAVPASIGFMLTGLEVAGRPPLSLGYVNWGAALVILPLSMLFAPIGARLAHSLDVDLLRRVFAGFMALVAIKLWAGILM